MAHKIFPAPVDQQCGRAHRWLRGVWCFCNRHQGHPGECRRVLERGEVFVVGVFPEGSWIPIDAPLEKGMASAVNRAFAKGIADARAACGKAG